MKIFCIWKYINRVKIFQAVCSSLKQDKFPKQQSKSSFADFISSFTNLKKSIIFQSLNTQYLNQIGLKFWDSWLNKYSYLNLNLLLTFNLSIFGSNCHSVILLWQAGNLICYFIVYFVCLVHDYLKWLLSIVRCPVDSGSFSCINYVLLSGYAYFVTVFRYVYHIFVLMITDCSVEN